jgi:hypothetical protein
LNYTGWLVNDAGERKGKHSEIQENNLMLDNFPATEIELELLNNEMNYYFAESIELGKIKIN